jgi:hypothetical protein
VIEEGITFRDEVVLNMINLKAMMQLVFIAAKNGSDKEKFQESTMLITEIRRCTVKLKVLFILAFCSFCEFLADALPTIDI